MLIFSFIPYDLYKDYSKAAIFLTAGLLIVTLFVAHDYKGAGRWLNLGFTSFQPADVAKLVLIIHLSVLLEDKGDKLKNYKHGFLYLFIWVIIISGLILIQPNISTGIILVIISLTLLYVGGAKLGHIMSSLFFSLLACVLNSANLIAIAANISPLIMFVAAIGSLIHSAFTQRDATSRAQLQWAIGGFVAGLGLNLFSFLPSLGWVQNPGLAAIFNDISNLGVVVTGICLSIAVLRFHLFDIEVIIRKTLLYSALTIVLAAIYFSGVVLLQQLFRGISGQNSSLAVILTTLVIAALFNPMRHRLQNGIDQRFYRQKYDAAQALAQFNHTASYEVDIERLSVALIRTVYETLQPETLSLWLKETNK